MSYLNTYKWDIWIQISEISEYRYIYDMAEHLFSDQFCRKTREFGLNTDHPPIWQKKYRPTSYFITAVWIKMDFWSLISSCIILLVNPNLLFFHFPRSGEKLNIFSPDLGQFPQIWGQPDWLLRTEYTKITKTLIFFKML